MLDDDKIEAAVRELILDVCEILHKHGLDSVQVGAMMRLVGVDGDFASRHDNEYFMFDQTFLETIKNRKKRSPRQAPVGATIH